MQLPVEQIGYCNELLSSMTPFEIEAFIENGTFILYNSPVLIVYAVP